MSWTYAVVPVSADRPRPSIWMTIFAIGHKLTDMATMNISLPDELRQFAEAQVSAHLYASGSEYVRELIRRDRDNVLLREAVLAGVRSGDGADMDADYFARLRGRFSDAS